MDMSVAWWRVDRNALGRPGGVSKHARPFEVAMRRGGGRFTEAAGAIIASLFVRIEPIGCSDVAARQGGASALQPVPKSLLQR
ncbi:hypothetical protein ACU16_02880 [Xanthomonas oryzae pv. oryzicola]|nr:hypothetical protein ACU16_02880 [Xanthomonas oryzae pv. oryzicola]AKO09804.1 hypothetical protein ACU17_19050 [Xanthomonas oryzae pv. oryzicola]OWB28917.1 hypothetical protein XocBAI20_11975 [Xanthomonas oryzae pv. oryzicola]